MNRDKSISSMFMLIALTTALVSSALAGELSFQRNFTDNMVIQRDKPVVVSGFADKGSDIEVSFAGQTKKAKADKDGIWSVRLEPVAASAKGATMTAKSSGKEKSISNIVVGDVYLFGRQSYIDITLGRDETGKQAASRYKPSDTFRVITISTIPAKDPQSDLAKGATVGWRAVDNKNALDMSAAAFYLGADLVKDSDVPVGIIDLNMGHHFGISWLSSKAIDDIITTYPKNGDIPWIKENMPKELEERESGKAQADLDAYYQDRMQGKGPKPLLGLHPLKNPIYPSCAYNAVISPLKNLSVKAVLLQLGNDYPFIAYRELEKDGLLATKPGYDAGWHHNYIILKNGYRITDVTLPYVVSDWRRSLQDKDLPIGLILPPASDLDVYAAHNREIRELHRRTAEKEGNIGLIMPGNQNVPASGQPADEKVLAERCKQWVLGAAAGNQDVAASGPVFEKMTTQLGKATIYFQDGTADGLKDIGDALDNFETAGPDREFRPAKAKIDGSTIKLKAEGPVTFVRFNWNYKPDQGLVNSQGLPALPFNTDADWTFGWIPPPEEPDLPEEYSTTADKWEKSDVAIINGQIAALEQGDSAPIPIEPGPIGFRGAPFGPNIIVISVNAGTPAEGKLQTGDVIYGVNGQNFQDGDGVAKDAQYFVLADAITESESEEAGGKMVLSLRRGTKLMDVELQLKVMGSYSSTSPYYCEKSENIVKDAEAWITRRYRPESGHPSPTTGMLNTDMFFVLATGDPEVQGLVRRAVYDKIAKMTPEEVTQETVSKPWHTGHESMLLGEYFHATGDRNVLPYLKYMADLSSASQLKPPAETPATKEAAQSEMQVGGWRQNYPGSPDRWQSGYGLMPHAGMSCVMGMQLGKEAGLDIDERSLAMGIKHFNYKRAEYGFVLYSYWNLWREGPPLVSPEAEANGKLWSMNGKLGMAASLFNMLDGYKTAVDTCSRHCVYGFNNTRGGHGGMFFNNFWTPVGAWAGGEKGFKHFMKGQRWWRELFRRSDGAFNQAGRGGVGVSYGLPYVAQKQRLRMLGAPVSAFGTNCPAFLKPAVEAHKKRDYALCEKLIVDYMNDNPISPEDKPVVDHLLESVQILQKSIDHDLSYCEKLISEGKHYYASLELPQLKGVVSEDNQRLAKIVKDLESPDGAEKVAVSLKDLGAAPRRGHQPTQAEKPEKWVTLIAQAGKNGEQESDTWKMKIVEHIKHAPEEWTSPRFDDSSWMDAKTPLAWTMYHTALFRGKFDLEDKQALDGLRVQGNFFQQQNVLVYLNGELVAKLDNLERGTGTADIRFTDYALKLLKNGENTIAISSRHKRRWGSYRGTYKTASPMGFWVEAKERE